MPTERPRRLRCFVITAQALVKVMTTGSSFSIIDGIPPGARLVRLRQSDDMRLNETVELVVEHPSFDELQPNMMAPHQTVAVEHRTDLELLAQTEYSFTVQSEDDMPTWVLYAPARINDAAMRSLSESVQQAQLPGRVLLLPADCRLERADTP